MAALKYSRQRESIKEFLMTQTTHPTADIVYDNMKQIYPNISLGTVYRNLSLLTDLGEIQKLSCFGGADRYDARTSPHCHFMCTSCGSVMDLDIDAAGTLVKEAEEQFSGKITGYSARFFGLCEECIKKQAK
ncbi:MAG: transcriptional repressor [Eubacteriales bacterium]|nr:transcriptional repressor [Eubacteriales bacterium]